MARLGRVSLAVLALFLAGAAAWLALRGSGREDAPRGPGRSPAAPAVPGPGAAPPRDASPADVPAAAPAPPAPGPPPAGRGVLVLTVRGLPWGDPLAGAEVEVRGDSGEGKPLASRTTGADGVARFEGLEPDAVRVRASAPGRVPGAMGVSDLSKPGERTVTIDLEPGVALGGIVLEAGTRRPLPGAVVVAEKGGAIGGMSSFHSDPALTETRADAEGRFRVDGIPRGEIVTLSASARGHVRAARSLLLGEGAETHPALEFLLEEGCSAAGTVTDPEGRPVAGARVWAVAVEPGGGEAALARFEAAAGPWVPAVRAEGEAGTDGEGRFLLEGLRAGTPYRFVARGGPFARSPASDPPVAAEAPGKGLAVDLRLRRPAVLRVRVADPAGAAPAGAEVRILAGRAGHLAPADEGGGACRFDLLVAGEYEVEAEAPGLAGATETVALGEGETKEVRIALAAAEPPPAAEAPPPPKPGSLRLRLVPPAGSPLPARVKVSIEETRSGGGTGYTRGLKDGLVVLDGLPAEPVRVVVFAEGFAPAVRDVEVGPGEERDLGEVPLDQGGEIAGLVQDAAGTPLAGARVVVRLPGFENAVATTGADGRFRVPRLPPGDLFVRVASPGLLDGRDTVAVAAGVANRTWTLVPAVPIRGTARAPGGKAPEGLRVVFLLQGGAPPGVPRETTVWPDDGGEFSLEVAAGSYAVEARDGEGRVLLRREAAFEGKAGGRVDLELP